MPDRLLRLAIIVVLIASTAAIVVLLPSKQPGSSPSGSAGSPSTAPAASTVASPDPSIGPRSIALTVRPFAADPIPNPPSAPTADVGQAKVWEHDDRWWAALIDPGSGAFHIFRLEPSGKAWTDTGVVVDDRPGAHPDAIVAGAKLYTVSAGRSRNASARPEVRRFSYTRDAGWTLDRGFPAAVHDVGVSSTSIARDSAGHVWVGFVDQARVYVNASRATEADWGPAWRLAGAGTVVRDEDVARLVAYGAGGGRVGVFWSNQADQTFRFASHRDGADPAEPSAWSSETVASGERIADNHVDVMTAPIGGAERVMAVVKTSRNEATQAGRNEPLIMVLAQRAEGGWTQSVVGRVRDHQTRPMLLVDPTNRLAVVVTTHSDVGTHIAWQAASLDDLRFSPGGDQPLIGDDDDLVVDASSTHAAVDLARGAVIVAWDQKRGRYEHAVLSLGG